MSDNKNSPSDTIASADTPASPADVQNEQPETFQAYQERSGLESLESAPQDAVTATGPIVSAAALPPSPEVHVSGPLGKLYRSHLRTVLIVGGVALVLLIAGILALLMASKHHPKPQTSHTKSAAASSPSGRTLTINSNLLVTQNTTIEKDLTVNGTTTLQGVLVKADASIGGNLNVQGNGNFTGSISAANFNGSNLTVTGNSNFSGTITVSNVNATGSLTVGGTVIASNLQGTFQGTFIGDGSQITNINASSCSDCVKLQNGPVTNQTGSIGLNGDAIIAGTVTGRKLHIQPSTNDTQTVAIQDANGANVLSIDTINHRITAGDLLPQTPGSLTAGTLLPGISFGEVVADAGDAYNDNDHWVAMGSDGFLRIIFINQDTSDVTYVRCESKDCTTNVTKVVASDTDNWDDSPAIALDHSGNAYISFVDYSDPETIELVHCLDQDCNQTTQQTAGTDANYNDAISVGSDGLPNVVYDTYQNDPNLGSLNGLNFVHCLNADCSSNSTQVFVPLHPASDNNNAWEYYEAQAMATGPDGFMRIAYVHDGWSSVTNQRVGEVWYIRCEDAGCTQKITNTVDTGQNMYYVALAVGSDGLARIAYEGPTNWSDLSYAVCNDVDCSSATITLLTDQLDDTPDIALDSNGLARISYDSYFDNTDHLIYLQCLNATCSQFNQKTLDDNLDYSNSIALDSNGLPQMAYFVDYQDSNGNWTDSLNVVSLATVDGSDLRVAGDFTAGTNIGDANNLFGQIYGQGVNLQTASSSAALIINQVGVKGTGSFGETIDEGSGPIAQFQINGTTRAEFDKNGTLLMNGIGSADLANFQINGQRVFRVDRNGTLSLQPQDNQIADLQQWQASNGAVRLGVNGAGQFYAPLSTDQGQAAGNLTIDKTGLNVVDASSVTQASLTSDGSLQLGPAALEKYKYVSLVPNTNPFSSVAVDVNGDGLPDIISDDVCNTVSVFINRGSGNFATRQSYSASGCHYRLATADFNGDGHPDIAVPDTSGFMNVMFNNGDGTFANAVAYPVGFSPQSGYSSYVISAADLNGDGHPDLAGTTLDGYEVLVLLNNGDGTFGAPASYVINQNLSYCAYDQVIADFNGDGHPDILSESCATTILITNNGDGTFGAPSTAGSNGYSLATADFNGDGHPDFVTGYSGIGLGINNGAGTFTVTNLPNVSCGSYDVSASDVDGDGHPDISFVNYCNGRLETYINNGSGTFAAPKETIFPGQGSQVWGLTYADVLGTGLQIPIISDFNTNHINLILPKPAPKLQVSGQDPTGTDVLLVGTPNQSGEFLRVQDANRNVLDRIDNSGALSIGDNGGYSYATAYTESTIAFAPATLTNAATTLNIGNDSTSSGITLPFSFKFYGQGYSSIYIATNGYVTFLPGQGTTCCGITMPSTAQPTGVIAAYLQHLNISSGGTIKYETQGTAPNRTFIIEYNNIQSGSGSYHVTTQIQLHEGSNNIDIQTTDAGPYWCATEAIESMDGKYAVVVPGRNNTCFTVHNDGVRFTYNLPASFSPARLSVINNDGASIGELIKAAVQQTADLLQFQDANGNVTARVDNQGNINAGAVTSTQLTASTINGVADPNAPVTSGSLDVSWYNSDSGSYKTVGNGSLAFKGTDGPINWPNLGNSRPAGVNGDYINSRWTGWIKADYSETYTFYTASDDGSRLYINNQLVVNNWFDQGATERSGTFAMTAGQWVPITVEFYQGIGAASVTASWSSPSVPKALIPANSLGTGSTKLQILANTILVGGKLQNASGTGASLTLNGSTAGALIATNGAANKGLVIQGAVGQTADLFQIVDSAGLNRLTVSSAGDLTVAGNLVSGGLSSYAANTNYILDPTLVALSPGRGSGTRQQVTGQAGTATGRATKITPANDWTTIGQTCALPSGGTWTMSFMAWTDSGTTPISALDGPGTGAGNVTATTTPKRYSVTWNHPGSCNSFEIGPSSGTNPVYIADWQVEAGTSATAFFYGGSGAGYSWAGAANNSVSLRKAGTYSAGGVFANGALEVIGLAGGQTCCGNAPAAPLAVNIIGGKGGTTVATGQVAGQGGGSLIMGGPGGDGVVTNTNGGWGGDITLKGGTGGTGTGNGNGGNGGSLIFQGGTPGTGVAAGAIGQISLQASGGNVNLGTLTTADASARLAISTGSVGGKGVVIQAVASQTADLLQAQSSTGAVLAKIDASGNLTVKAATINGHIITGNTTGSTTATVNGNAGAGASCTVSGNDTSGTVTIVSGSSGTAAGVLCTINFAASYGSAPRVVFTPGNASSAQLQYYRGSATGSFTISSVGAPATGTTYSYDYHIEQ